MNNCFSKIHTLNQWCVACGNHTLKLRVHPPVCHCGQIDYTVVQPSGYSTDFLHTRINSDCSICVHESRHMLLPSNSPFQQHRLAAAGLSALSAAPGPLSVLCSPCPPVSWWEKKKIKKLTTYFIKITQ